MNTTFLIKTNLLALMCFLEYIQFQSLLLLSIDTSLLITLFGMMLLVATILLLIYSKYKRLLTGKRKEIRKLRAETEQLQSKNTLLLRERTDLEKVLKSTQISLVKASKSYKDSKQIIDRLHELLEKLKADKSIRSANYTDLTRVLNAQEDSEAIAFQIHMDELNQRFTSTLKEQYPNLTVYDLRLCTYIRSGISTREIAKMTNVLPSSINVSRSRLRKKLSLEIKQDLFSFLTNF